jgi:hypothetical protein
MTANAVIDVETAIIADILVYFVLWEGFPRS